MIIATFNVENMFERPKALNMDTWKDGKSILEDYSRLNHLIQEEVYTDAIKTELLEIMERHPGLIAKSESKYIRLRDVRGKFLYKPKNKSPQVVANGRFDWIGWFELIKETVDEVATENTARIIGLLNADVLCIVEADNRVNLKRFNEDVLPKVKVNLFDHIMLIDGNDDRGIDVGILTKKGFPITQIRSHIDDTDHIGEIFSRDCAEYEITTAKGNKLLVMVNHFKSKGYGNYQQSAEKRLRQATRVREIYDAKKAEGYIYIAITGDLNEPPDETPMDPLIRQKSDLTDIMVHPDFQGDGREGTHGNGTKSAKFDYILMSPELSKKVIKGGIERRGVWGGKNGTLFPHIAEITTEKEAASDHASLWAEVDI